MATLLPPKKASTRALFDAALGPATPTPATPTLRAPTPYERYIQPVTDLVEKASTWLGGETPEEQAMAMMPSPLGMGGAAAVTLAPRLAPEALKNLVRAAEGVDVSSATLAKPMQYLREAVDYYAQKYPRLLSHLDKIEVQPSLASRNAQSKGAQSIANMDMSHAGTLAQRPGGVKHLNEHRRPIGSMNISAEAMENWALPEQAREVVGHELAHTGQFLSDPSRMHLAYADANELFGYASNPAEDLANMVGRGHRYGPRGPQSTWKEVTSLAGGEDRAQAQRNWKFFREPHVRENLKGERTLRGTRVWPPGEGRE